MSQIAFRPGVEIETRFQQATSTAIPTLSAFIVGPAAKLIRYDKSTEKPLGSLGRYLTTGNLDAEWSAYNYAGKAAGDVVDTDFVKLFVDNALLEYYSEAGGSIQATSLTTLKHSSKSFISNPLGTNSAHAVFGDREVKVGDPILVNGIAGSTPFALATYVAGFNATLTSASVASAVAGSRNYGTASGSTSVSAGSGNGGGATATLAGTYNGKADGITTETYRVEVIRASTGGDAETALLKVTSGSGTDNVPVVVPAPFADPTNIGTRGLTLTFEQVSSGNLAIGDVWTITAVQTFTAPSLTTAGTYSATDYTDRRYTIEVIQGGALAGSKVRISEANGKDSTKVYTLAIASGSNTVPVALGSRGLTVAFNASAGLITGDSWSIAATAAQPNAYTTIKLAHSMPVGTVLNDNASITNLKLFIRGNYEIPRKSVTPGVFNFETEASQVKIRTDVYIEDPNWTVDDIVIPLPLKGPSEFRDVSKLFLETRIWAAPQTQINGVSSVGEVDELIPGPTDMDNPLRLAVVNALAGSAGRTVYFFNIGSPDVIGNWEAGFFSAERARNAYGLVPLSVDPAVISSAMSFASSMGSPDRNMDKVVWITAPELKDITVVSSANSTDEEEVLATISDDGSTSGTQYTLVSVTSGNSDFTTSGVRAGDKLWINFGLDAWGEESYDVFTIDSVLNETSLLLVSGPDSQVGVPKKIEIHRVPNVADRVQERVARASTYASYINRYLPFSKISAGGAAGPAYHLAAFLAGLRSRLAPHQAMTRLTVTGFDIVTGATGFSAIPEMDTLTETQLNDLAEVGGFIVAQDPITGLLTIRHGITVGPYNNVNVREESIISNVHSIKFGLFDLLNPYIGQANLTANTLVKIRTELSAYASTLLSANANDVLGGQLIEMNVLQIRQSPVFKDTLLLDIEILVPAPINRIRLTLYVR